MKLLILGGTIFLGRHLVTAAQASGHEVTLFNRGKHNPDLFPGVEKLRGDRTVESDLDAAFAGRTWDAVIDTCGYVPRVVGLSAARLADKAQTYCFISSVSVYPDMATPGLTESAPVGTLDDPTAEDVTGETYGPLKALCEQAVERAFPNRALVLRPGLIVGPHDPSDRFTYWPHRISKGGGVLTPDRWEMPAQVIDGRDLAQWTICLLEQKATGTFNAVGPDYPLTLGDILMACQAAAQNDARLVRVPEAFLASHNVSGWSELPVWIPASENGDGLGSVSYAKAVGHGLTFRPLETIIADTLAWDTERTPSEPSWRNTLTPKKEAEVLAAWAAIGQAK